MAPCVSSGLPPGSQPVSAHHAWKERILSPARPAHQRWTGGSTRRGNRIGVPSGDPSSGPLDAQSPRVPPALPPSLPVAARGSHLPSRTGLHASQPGQQVCGGRRSPKPWVVTSSSISFYTCSQLMWVLSLSGRPNKVQAGEEADGAHLASHDGL